MDLKRSLFLLILAFGTGFVGKYLVHEAQQFWPDVFLDGGLLAALFLALLWGTPRGILERKPLEIVLGCALVFGGLLLLPLFEQRYLAVTVTKLVTWAEVAADVARQAAVFAILGFFVGIIDGLYEFRLNKALLGGALSAGLGAAAAFVHFAFPGAQPMFVTAFNWGLALCLMHLGTVFTQGLTGSKENQRDD